MPATGDDLIQVTGHPPLVAEAIQWTARPDCGAVVTFCGFVRDHSGARTGVTGLRYEAYEAFAAARMRDVAGLTRARFPGVRRLALLHRIGDLSVGDLAVVVAASTPHRDEAFAAASFAITTVKQTVPIWKLEMFADAKEWVAVCSIESDRSDGGPPSVEMTAR